MLSIVIFKISKMSSSCATPPPPPFFYILLYVQRLRDKTENRQQLLTFHGSFHFHHVLYAN